MQNDLANSFLKAEQVNKEQEEKLRNEINKEQNVINRIMHEIMWGESKNNMLFDLSKEYNITNNEFDLFYKQALKHIEEGTKWYKI
jgi:archaellum biogenesis protein FlaJ (TadC family)